MQALMHRALLLLLALVALTSVDCRVLSPALRGGAAPSTSGSSASPAAPLASAEDEAVDEADDVEADAEPEAEAEEGEEGEEESEPMATMAATEEEAVMDEEAAPPKSGAASVQWVVTQKMKSQLTGLGYSAAEIAELDAERAAAIIRRSISRPGSGVPSGWNKGERRKSGKAVSGGSLLSKVSKPFTAMGMSQKQAERAGPVIIGALVVGLFGAVGGSILGAGAAVAPRVILPTEEEEPTDAGSDRFVSTEALWLDRQIDYLIMFLKSLVGK